MFFFNYLNRVRATWCTLRRCPAASLSLSHHLVILQWICTSRYTLIGHAPKLTVKTK